MNDRNKILIQFLFVAEEYNIEIIKINFRNKTSILDEAEFTFKNEHDKFIIKLSYEKNNVYDVNSVGHYIKYKLRELI